MKLTQYIDTETGEKLLLEREVMELMRNEERKREGYKKKLARDNAREAARNQDKREFLKVINDRMSAINKDISLLDAGLLFKLALNLRLGNGSKLVTGKRDAQGKLKPLKQSDMQRLLGKSTNGIKKALGRLEALGVIRKEGEGRRSVFYVDENLICIGKSEEAKPFTKVYRVHARDILEGLTDNEAGLLLKATAYVNHQFLMLTHDPTEQDVDKAKPLRIKEAAALLGVEESHFSVLLSGLKRKGAVATFDTGKKGKAILIHPYLCDRGNDKGEVASLVANYFRISLN
ncbi:hypothetical protein [Bacillus cereus]|uniref:hypothetical protein n=1 Tax=Bacillus cereus TaxID=1396 RepID=UPI0009377B3D|nr:hypothetical protein [Bacillus cereus]OKA23409.1 hypothetical protein BJR05_23565 [Bacillus cereus]